MSAMVETLPVKLEEQLQLPLRSDALLPLRQRAAKEFSRSGYPTTRNEEWRFTNVAPIARAAFVTASSSASLRALSLGSGVDEISIVNGALSTPLPHCSGITFRRGDELTDDDRAHVGELASNERHPFAALNLAFASELLFVDIEAGVALSRPLHIVHQVQGGEDQPSAAQVRVVIRVGRGASAAIVESFRGDGRYLTNHVTEMTLADGAIVDHVRLQDESLQSWHMSNLQFVLKRDAVLRTTNISLGSSLGRIDIGLKLDGNGADAVMNGLYLLNGGQHFENHTLIDHASPHTSSLESYKGILDGHSNGIFDAKIVVRKDAQKITSKQSNKNLLLSDSAVADSNPQLEIHADDVKCGHGSTIGQLDEGQVFYLRSRGLGEAEARTLLTYGFAREIVDAIRIEQVRTLLQDELLRLLPGTPQEAA